MKLSVRTIAVLAGLAAGPVSAEVSLRAGDAVIAEGELLGFDGRFYRLLGPHGEVTLDGRELTCEGTSCPALGGPEILRISGEGWVIRDVLLPLIETFTQREGFALEIAADPQTLKYSLMRDGETEARIELFPTTSAEGIADLVADVADLVVTLRPPTDAELSLAREAGRGDLSRHERRAILGLEGIVPIVSDLSPRDALRPGWSATVAPGRLHLPDPSTAAGHLVREQFPRLGRSNATYHRDLSELAQAVAEDPDSVGLTLLSKAGNARPIPLAGACDASLAADRRTLQTEDYPYTVPILIYAPARRLPGIARDFVDYATSPVAQTVIRRAGVIDQFPESIDFSSQGDRLGLAILSSASSADLSALRSMVTELKDRSRLSLSFRFRGGSSELDAQSYDNVARLARAIGQGLFNGREILFAGFTDEGGPSSVNRVLSRERAERVRDAVAEAAGNANVSLTVQGFGETFPIACDDTDWGRRVNRRVEVWIGGSAATGVPRPGN